MLSPSCHRAFARVSRPLPPIPNTLGTASLGLLLTSASVLWKGHITKSVLADGLYKGGFYPIPTSISCSSQHSSPSDLQHICLLTPLECKQEFFWGWGNIGV
jgi:hypothetical protein